MLSLFLEVLHSLQLWVHRARHAHNISWVALSGPRGHKDQHFSQDILVFFWETCSKRHITEEVFNEGKRVWGGSACLMFGEDGNRAAPLGAGSVFASLEQSYIRDIVFL